MVVGMTSSICSFVYTCLVLVVYLKKIKLKNDENTIYTFLIFSNVVGLILEFFVYLFALIPNIQSSFLPYMIERLYFVYLFTWVYTFTIYIYITSFEHKTNINYKLILNKNRNIVLFLIYIFFVFFLLWLPVVHVINEKGTYSTGPACLLLYVSAMISILLSLFFVLKNRKKLDLKKRLPMLSLVFCIVVLLVVRSFIPEALFVSSFLSFVTILTYFTIENPDIKMSKELAFSKELSENAKNQALKILDNISIKLEDSLDEMQKFSLKEIDYNNALEMKKELKYIKRYSSDFVNKISNIIDVSKILSGSLSSSEDEYDVKKIFEDIEKSISCSVNKKVYITYGSNIPELLYGDYIKIKKLILFIVDYLSLELENDLKLIVDTFSVGSFCKLKIRFFNTNLATEFFMTFSNMNDVDFYKSKDFSIKEIKVMKVLQVAKLLNASINLEENEVLTVAIVQKTIDPYNVLEEKSSNITYFKASNKRVLLVSNIPNDIKKLNLLLKPYDVEIDISKTWENARNMLEDNKTYDLILIDEALPRIEEFNMKSMKKFIGYNFKCILMISKISTNDYSQYVKKNYDDVLVKPFNKNNINNLLKKYLKNN